MNFTLRYEDNGTLHNDIQLQLGNEAWTCDSYYFAIDHHLQEDDDSATKVKAVLRKLLEQWLSAAQTYRMLAPHSFHSIFLINVLLGYVVSAWVKR